MNRNCCWALYPFLPCPCCLRRALAVADARLLLAPEHEPERGGVDDRARAGLVLGEGPGAPGE
eukprot:5674969-Pyramimonas_sp.AAC.1